MTEDDLIDGVIEREKGFVDHPNDRGGATKFGVTAKTLGLWRKYGRQATRQEVRDLTLAEAKEILRVQYLVGPGFDAIKDDVLRVIVVDDGILSGQTTAAMTLQRCLGVRDDGVIGKATKAALQACDPRVVAVRVIKARLVRYAQIVENNRTQGDFIEGWVVRAIGFLGDDGRPRA